MKKIIFILILILSGFSISVYSQQRLDFSGNGEMNLTSGYFIKYVATDKYVEIDGTPYYNDDWAVSIIKIKNGLELKIDSCKYDVYEEKLMFLNDNVPLYFSNPQDITNFSIGNSNFINLQLGKENDFYENLVEGKNFKLLKDYTCDFLGGKESVGIVPATRDKYSISFIYYYKTEGSLDKIKLKEKSIIELLRDKQNEIKKYIEDNNLNVKEEKDLIKIFEFYSSLQ